MFSHVSTMTFASLGPAAALGTAFRLVGRRQVRAGAVQLLVRGPVVVGLLVAWNRVNGW